MDYIRAACIRARVTDPLSQARLEALSDACTKLAAVRAWRDGLRLPPMPNDWTELDAILDGKETE